MSRLPATPLPEEARHVPRVGLSSTPPLLPAERDPLAALLRRRVEGAYALLRAMAGLLFAFHGAQKLLGLFADHPRPPVGSELWFGGLIELFGGLAIAAGLFTPWAAFLASGEMAVAYVQMHWKLAFDARFFPIVNKGELALLYCFLFFFIACRGSGRWSLDASWRRRF